MQLYVQKSISTTFPRESCSPIVNGSELNHRPRPVTSNSGVTRGAAGVGVGVAGVGVGVAGRGVGVAVAGRGVGVAVAGRGVGVAGAGVGVAVPGVAVAVAWGVDVGVALTAGAVMSRRGVAVDGAGVGVAVGGAGVAAGLGVTALGAAAVGVAGAGSSELVQPARRPAASAISASVASGARQEPRRPRVGPAPGFEVVMHPPGSCRR